MSVSYYVPVVIVVVANTVYQICTKSINPEVNTFFSLIFTYAVSLISCIVLFLFTGNVHDIAGQMKSMNWASVVLGFALVGLEIGFILLYRRGWNANVGSVVCNIALAVVMVFVGYFLYKEHISMRTIAGIGMCIGGIVLITLGK